MSSPFLAILSKFYKVAPIKSRALHYWSAQVMVVAVIPHIARIVFTAGYRPPRDVNWLIGLGLLVITLMWDFSGYVLRYDGNTIWALLVGTNLLKELPGVGHTLYLLVVGDQALGPSTILRFYTWHVFGLTLLGFGGIGYHIWRIRVDGGISHPAPTSGAPRQAAVFDSAGEFKFAGCVMGRSTRQYPYADSANRPDTITHHGSRTAGCL